jgi:hypothetical protein
MKRTPLHHLDAQMREAVYYWRQQAEDPAMTEGRLRQELRHTATVAERLMETLKVQEDMTRHLRTSFWLMTLWSVILGCLLLWRE